MPKFGEFIVIYDLLPEIAAKLPDAVSKIVRKTAFDIAAMAMANIEANGQVDTGFMLNSVYVEVHDGENMYPYGRAMPTKQGQELLPEVAKPGKTVAIIAVGANYGIYQEMGTVHQPARPFMAPAAAMGQLEFNAAMAKLEAFLAVV